MLAKNRADFAELILSHPFHDRYFDERAPKWDKINVPFLSAANWGGQGLHLRGNVEGFVRAASKQKWLECHGLEHWTHYYTDYGRKLQLEFFDHFLKGKDNGWDKRSPVLLQTRHVDKFVERTENEWPIARTKWTKYYLNPDDMSLGHDPADVRQDRQFRRTRQRRDLSLGATDARDRNYRSIRRQAAHFFLDHGRGPVSRASRLRSRGQGSLVLRSRRSAYADQSRVAARVAPQARPRIVDVISALPQSR